MYAYPAVFSVLNSQTLGGTCTQLLWHARNLIALGAEVQVLGASSVDVTEFGVEFVGTADRNEQMEAIRRRRVRTPDVVLLEGAVAAAELFRRSFPSATIIHIGQNIDRYSAKSAFRARGNIDIYGFVSPGHLADFCVRVPALRHKFALVRNAIPWEWMYNDITPSSAQDKIAWVGYWGKEGLRDWAVTMSRILREFPSYQWVLYGPRHNTGDASLPAHILRGLSFAANQVRVDSLPLSQLILALTKARVVLVSLGNETACVSALDAHAAGRPVISGNDIVFKFVNPEGTGVRVWSARQRYAAVKSFITNTELADVVGANGRSFVREEFSEAAQRRDIRQLLNRVGTPALPCYAPPSDTTTAGRRLLAKLQRRLCIDMSLGRGGG
jgi:glycosyltransferase involved in cell wall biosynthesis